MFSDDVKLVFGFEPSGLLEKMILAPRIGTPRTLPPRGLSDEDDESELEVPGSVFVEVGGVSFFSALGTLIFGIVIVNCPIAGKVNNDATAIVAITMSDDDLVINMFLSNVKFVGAIKVGKILA
jgi:hypothetical protein